jgi:hypothetical protein
MIFFIISIFVLLLIIGSCIRYLTAKSKYISKCPICYNDNNITYITIRHTNYLIGSDHTTNTNYAQYYTGTVQDNLVPRIRSLTNYIVVSFIGIYNINQHDLNIPGDSVKCVYKQNGSNTILPAEPLVPYMSLCNVDFTNRNVINLDVYKGIVKSNQMLLLSFGSEDYNLYRIIFKLSNIIESKLLFCFFIKTSINSDYNIVYQVFVDRINNSYVYTDV